MKFSTTVAVAAFVATAAAQLDKVPACAQGCLAQNILKTNCGPGINIECACKDSKFVSDSFACAKAECSAAEYENGISGAVGLCKSVGVDITPPGGDDSAPSSSAAATTSAPAETSSAPAETSSAISSAMSSVVSSVSETASATEAPSSYSIPATTLETTTAAAPSSYVPVPVPVPTGNSTATPTVPTAPPANSNAASSLAASGALMVFGAVAAFFM